MQTVIRNLPWLFVFLALSTESATQPQSGLASWYGEEHRGKTMANGRPFDPGQLTAASWFYPLGTTLRVSAVATSNSVEVVVTDRGPARHWVRQGRILDLSRSAFARLADCARGVIAVRVDPKQLAEK